MRLSVLPFPLLAPFDLARRHYLCKGEKAAEGYLFLLEKDAEYDVDSSFGM
jgi:hypothetical protein